MRTIAPVAITFVVYLLGCAADLPRTPTTFKPTNDRARTLVFQGDVEVTPSTGYTRTLKSGSVWREVGAVPQGTVYRIQDDVFMLEGAHMHEAHCVIVNNTLVGFFLPVEQAFVAISSHIPLPVNSR